ncbi:MAG: prepilin-type N-terminal cleavage/methylation domain-containing protein [Planctomycetota bacterium]
MITPHPYPRTSTRPTTGFSLLEVLIALPIIAIAASMLFSTIAAAARQKNIHRENRRVTLAVRSVLEQMRNEDLASIFPLYNAEPFDDPSGPGTAPGNRFAIEGIAPRLDAADARVAEIFLPAIDVSGGGPTPIWQVREDAVLPDLGLPRDLNLDSIVDDQDHSLDYRVLPVRVEVSWQGALGPRTLVMQTVLTEFRQD